MGFLLDQVFLELAAAQRARHEYAARLGQHSRGRKCPMCFGKGAHREWRPGDAHYDPQREEVCPRCEGTGLFEDDRR